ncbi:hypothetical protein SAMN05421770_10772 [Granulicella rosea]|uniref:Uncharacterized protein n=1 Tax=Granulicella rosea TaxID=474952 RepID=A0A239LKX8_9BACT|nr:hypothetical protein [Granulicella rosea]SNT30562.1 hypothetical protein SAMN05421770_10772 [Granulicella rosea]
MSSLLNNLFHGRTTEGTPAKAATTPVSELVAQSCAEEAETTMLKTIGWISAGLGAVAIGLFVGRELRQRYKFNRRTPYDFYAHSGDSEDMEFGVGV